MGRPTKYKEEYCDRVPELMKDGMAMVEVAAKLDVCVDTLNEWRKVHEVFSLAVKKGIELSEAWWVRQGRIALRDSKFNSTLWYMNMKNRFNWADKTELRTPDGLDININDMTEARKKELKELAALRAAAEVEKQRNGES